MSLAAARTYLSYSTLLSRAMGLDEYCYPEWGADGLPVNIEAVLRRLAGRFGTDLSVFGAGRVCQTHPTVGRQVKGVRRMVVCRHNRELGCFH